MKSACFKNLASTLILLTLFPYGALAKNTEILHFHNGDRLTGELKSLDRGKLSFKTDATGTINIEWDDVASVHSEQNIQVEISSGERYFGKLRRPTDEDGVVVLTDKGQIDLEDNVVVKMTPIDQEDWREWDIDISAGYNLTSANTVQQFNVGASAKHTTRKRIISTTMSSVISASNDNSTSETSSLEVSITRLRARRWLNMVGLEFSKNTELGTNLRTSVGAGIGRILRQTNHSYFSLGGGLKVSREDIVDETEHTDSLESYGVLNWDWFRYDSPQWDISTEFELIPSLTDWGRVRYEFDTTIKWEIVKDFFWTIELYDNFDNEPQSVDAENHDYGVITSITYTF